MHATCKGTSCNIVACIPCGTMLQDVGWCWIKFQNVQSFRNILKLKMLCVFGQLLHNVARCCIEMLRALDRTLRFIHNLAI